MLDANRLISTTAAAAVLGITPRAVTYSVRVRKLKARRRGDAFFYDVAEVERFRLHRLKNPTRRGRPSSLAKFLGGAR